MYENSMWQDFNSASANFETEIDVYAWINGHRIVADIEEKCGSGLIEASVLVMETESSYTDLSEYDLNHRGNKSFGLFQYF